MQFDTIRTPAPIILGLIAVGFVLSMLAQSSAEAVLGAPQEGLAALGATTFGMLTGLVTPMLVAFGVGAWVAMRKADLAVVMGMGVLAGVLAVTAVLVANLIALVTGGGPIVWFIALGAMAALSSAALRPAL